MGTKLDPGKFDCYKNAEPDEPMFVLLARDLNAPHIVSMWANDRKRRMGGVEDEKYREAMQCANDMHRWYAEKEGPDHMAEYASSLVTDDDLK